MPSLQYLAISERNSAKRWTRWVVMTCIVTRYHSEGIARFIYVILLALLAVTVLLFGPYLRSFFLSTVRPNPSTQQWFSGLWGSARSVPVPAALPVPPGASLDRSASASVATAAAGIIPGNASRCPNLGPLSHAMPLLPTADIIRQLPRHADGAKTLWYGPAGGCILGSVHHLYRGNHSSHQCIVSRLRVRTGTISMPAHLPIHRALVLFSSNTMMLTCATRPPILRIGCGLVRPRLPPCVRSSSQMSACSKPACAR